METDRKEQEAENREQRIDEKLHSLLQENLELTKRLISLTAITNFESTLTESMLQVKFYADRNSRNTYQELRSSAAGKLEKIMEKSDTMKVLEQNQKIAALELVIEQLNEKIETANQRQRSVESRNQKLDSLCKENGEALREYKKLVKWHEKRVEGVISIRSEKSFFSKPSWEEALAQFEEQQPKPRVPEIR